MPHFHPENQAKTVRLRGLDSLSRKIVTYFFFSEIPEAENFSFVFNTLLCDVAVQCKDHRNQMISAQVNLMEKIASTIEAGSDGDKFSSRFFFTSLFHGSNVMGNYL